MFQSCYPYECHNIPLLDPYMAMTLRQYAAPPDARLTLTQHSPHSNHSPHAFLTYHRSLSLASDTQGCSNVFLKICQLTLKYFFFTMTVYCQTVEALATTWRNAGWGQKHDHLNRHLSCPAWSLLVFNTWAFFVVTLCPSFPSVKMIYFGAEIH